MNELPQPRSFAALALDLPSSRMSVDFTNFTISQPQPQENAKRKLPVTSLVSQQITRKPIARSVPLPNVQEKPEPANNTSSQKSHRWLWSRQQPHEREIPVSLLSRTNSSASIASSNSNASTAASSVFSRDQSVSTSRTSLASVDFETPRSSQKKEPVGLSSLPLSLLESILAYALCLPLTVAIGPQSSERRHMQYRYHRAGLDYIDIQLIRKHPLFLVSHHIREVSLDVFNQKCDFVIDLHRIYHTKVASTMNDNLRLYEKFWVTEKPPKMVTDTLKSLYRLNLRLPVPSCENSGHRGRDEDDWVDGSDGQGGGNWRLKSMKREQEDAARVLRCLDSIMKLIMVEPAPKEIRGRAGSLSRTTSLKRSFSRSRSKSRGHVSERSDSRMAKEEQNKRQLKRLEVTLVKKNSYVMVLPDTLGLVKLLRAIPVGGFTKYYFELEEQQVLWATKHRKKWKGFEPDGTRLLNDLQHLTIAEKPIEPIRTPTQFKFVQIDDNGKLQLSNSPIIVLERSVPEEESVPNVSTPAARRMGLPWARKKANRRRGSNDSFAFIIDEGKRTIGTTGTNTSGRENPPSVDELRKIAEDIKNGLY